MKATARVHLVFPEPPAGVKQARGEPTLAKIASHAAETGADVQWRTTDDGRELHVRFRSDDAAQLLADLGRVFFTGR